MKLFATQVLVSLEPEEVIKKLHQTPYKFTYAHKVRSEVKKMADGELEYFRDGLKRLMRRTENLNLSKSIETILN